MMQEISHELMEMLNCETAFTIGGIPIAESTVVTWLLMVVMVAGSILLTRGFTVENPGRRQIIVETAVTSLQNILKGSLGEEGEKYTSYLVTVLIYLGLANTVGLFGMKPPTKDLNVTAALSIMSIILVQYAAIHARGVKGWVKKFSEPIALIAPINILELLIKPISLCMRLFGNILGAFTVMELIKICVPVGLPVPFCLYFDIFDGLLQAFIFVFLTSLFISEAME